MTGRSINALRRDHVLERPGKVRSSQTGGAMLCHLLFESIGTATSMVLAIGVGEHCSLSSCSKLKKEQKLPASWYDWTLTSLRSFS
eukprot:3873159-Amphidinium_carterae.2